MKLDVNYLTYITKEELRVLVAVEMGMRNHEYVPIHLIEKISHLKRTNAYKVIKLLLKNKLVTKVNYKYEGFKLTYLGYDYLSLYAFMRRGHVKTVLSKIGVGKESDIYLCLNNQNECIVLKFARLGRISFRSIKNNRDYLKHRTSFNWLYLSRLASIKEFTFMELLYKNGFPTPKPIDSNRHGILMSLIDGYPLCQVKELEGPESVFDDLINLIIKFAENGLIHSDFNEFNLMIDENKKITVIDFPQMVSSNHLNAEYYYKRDLDCILMFFEKKFNIIPKRYIPKLEEIQCKQRLDVDMKASGFIAKELKNLKELEILDHYNQEMDQLKEKSKFEALDADNDKNELNSDIDDDINNDMRGGGIDKQQEEREQEDEVIEEKKLNKKGQAKNNDEEEDEEIAHLEKDPDISDYDSEEEGQGPRDDKNEDAALGPGCDPSADHDDEEEEVKEQILEKNTNHERKVKFTGLPEPSKGQGEDKNKDSEEEEEDDEDDDDEDENAEDDVDKQLGMTNKPDDATGTGTLGGGRTQDTKKANQKPVKEKKTQNTDEYITQIFKKKLKFQKKTAKANKNQNKGKKKFVNNTDYFF